MYVGTVEALAIVTFVSKLPDVLVYRDFILCPFVSTFHSLPLPTFSQSFVFLSHVGSYLPSFQEHIFTNIL